ncbi:hypothetical protein BDV3_003505 [Batrachochytrium dendrobatidis]|uniref:Uncharacterized protein n=1 Tax=Batrachochytrium dendrobatidis (strain JEL423) TaxID=403673 RepID=A0A177WED1_BATDL|nr:hypothetical protein BDEG_21870 [Batrachochytrium dendrobatidis JEL423]
MPATNETPKTALPTCPECGLDIDFSAIDESQNKGCNCESTKNQCTIL